MKNAAPPPGHEFFATVTLAVMLATGMVVKGYADGAYTLDGTSIASR